MRWLAAAPIALLLTGCGSSAPRASALVDPTNPPLINSLEIDPSGDGLLMTTNRGLFHVANDDATPIRSVVKTPDGSSPVGQFLAIAASGDGNLLGSGHPDHRRSVAGFLGLLRSTNDGRTWSVVSRYSIADLHVIRTLNGSIYAYDAFLPGVIVSDDHGKDWNERTAPPTHIIDMVVDPSDPDHMLISSKQEIFRSTDGGESWSSAAGASDASMEWPVPESLYRADDDGLVYVSHNHADSWQVVGHVDGSVRALKAAGPEELYAALSDATILHSTDGGKTWDTYFNP